MSTAMLGTRCPTRTHHVPRHPFLCGRALLASSFALALVCLVPPEYALADTPKTVLVLSAETTAMPAVATVIDGTVAALRASGAVNVYVESLERSRFPSTDDRFVTFYKQRYGNRRMDLVVALCSPAVEWVRRHRADLFLDVPIVFGFVDRQGIAPIDPDEDITGVFLAPGFENLLRMALGLHPGVRKVVVVCGTSEFDLGWLPSAERAARDLEPKVSVQVVGNQPLQLLLGQLATVSDDSLILYVTLSRDGDGALFVPRDVADMIRRVSRVPVYGPSSSYIGHGVVGGALMDVEAHAADVGAMATRVLAGPRPSAVKPFATRSRLVFDARELRRFGIRESALPAGAAVVYRQESFWALNRVWMIGGVCLLLGQTALIGAMVAQRRKGRILEASLRARLRFETILSDVSRATGGVPVARIDIALRAALAVIRAYLGVDRVAVLELTDEGKIARAAEDALPGVPALPDGYVIADLPSIALTLASLQPFVMQSVDDLPAHAVRERATLQASGIRSLLLVPLEVGGRALGALSCVSHRKEMPWPADVLQQVGALARVVANVVERRRADTAVNESDRLRGAVLSSIPAHIAVLDRQGVIIAVNDAWLAYGRAHGVREEATISPGANYLKVCERGAAEGAPGAAEAFEGVLAVCDARRDAFEAEYTCDEPGTRRWYAAKATPLRRAEGGAVVTHRDITEQKRQELALRDLSGRLITAQEDERRRIARDLHDDLQQRLALLAIELDSIALGRAADGSITDRARQLWQRTNDIASEVHNLSHRLHPTKLEALGLLPTVQGYCRDLSKLGLHVTFTHDGVPATIPPPVALCLFRVVQESLQNVLKHSGVTAASVRMSGANGGLRTVVADAGRGFDVEAVSSRGGLGLVSQRERLHLVGGAMTIRSGPGRGTEIEFDVPLAADESGAAPSGAMREAPSASTAMRPAGGEMIAPTPAARRSEDMT